MTDISSLTTQVLTFCGPGKVLEVGSASGEMSLSVRRFGCEAQFFDTAGAVSSAEVSLELPFAATSFDTVVVRDCLEHMDSDRLPAVLQELRRVSRRYMLLCVPTVESAEGAQPYRSAGKRLFWEGLCFAAGWRKHPRYYVAADYPALQYDGAHIVIPLEKIPDPALDVYPLERLREERDLHMDMLRESGSRSDAHVFRYQLAARFVRPGDVVLDAACGLGYGSHLLWTGTRASRVIGIDGSEYAAKYASANFASARPGLEFREGFLPECLQGIPDNSVDMVISFETLEHVQDPEALLAEFTRVLAPGGRFIGSVPNDWSDETGEDPNPFHLHVYTLDKFREQLRSRFAVEKLYSQTADRVKRLGAKCEWVTRPRSIVELESVDADPIEAEWWLCVAMKSPLDGAGIPYVERHFTAAEAATAGHALAFARDYDNPWLVRSMIADGLRAGSALVQVEWAEQVLATSTADAPDRGAALAILAYRLLEGQSAGDAAEVMRQIEVYVGAPARNPNAQRWIISLRYVLALLYLRSAERQPARGQLEAILADDPAQYSVTLLTKAADAAWLLGLMSVSDGAPEQARALWRREGARLMRMVGGYMGGVTEAYEPPTFESRELAMVVRKVGRLFVGAKFADIALTHPTVFHAETEESVPVARNDVSAEERRQMRAEIHDVRTYLEAVLDGKRWLEENRLSTMAHVENLETVIRSRDQEISCLRAEIEALRDTFQR
jgi:ubiquinone/menaquinone biosynthesis C-methylase UbiE